MTRTIAGTSGGAGRIDSEAALEAEIRALSHLDPHGVGQVVRICGGPPPLRLAPAGFAGLARIVIAQQVSTASAAAMFGRLEAVLDPFEAQGLVGLSDDALRRCGLSRSKVKTLRAIADAIAQGRLVLERLAEHPIDEARARLLAIPGIGPWTTDVFLLFCLGHGDAWPAGDLALQEAARVLLKMDRRPDAAAMRRIGERWRPHRGAAAYLLWAYYRVGKGREGVPIRDTT